MAFLQYLIVAVLVAGSQAKSLVDRQTGCQTFCPFVFMPVCGSNGQTYSNECHLNVDACQLAAQFSNEADYEPLTMNHQGMCGHNQRQGSQAKSLVDRQSGCQTFCPFVFMPVCGSNGQTYSNECHLNVDACQLAAQFSNEADFEPLTMTHQGMCGHNQRQGKASCPTFCTFQFDPVCGSDGHTYSNSCQLNSAACMASFNNPESEPITFAHPGMC